MRLWAPYWDLLGSSHHLLDNFAAEERDGGDARKRFPGRLFAVLSTVRALAAMGKIDQLQRVLTTSTSLPGDPYGTSVGSLIVEGAREVAAHHGLEAARPYFERARDWYRSEEPANVVMRGISPIGMELRPQVKLAQGRWFTPGKREIVVSSRMAGRFANFELGQSFKTGGKELTVVGWFDGLRKGEELVLTNDHDPKPLYYSLLHEREGQFEWEYLAEGPEEWKVKIAKK